MFFYTEIKKLLHLVAEAFLFDELMKTFWGQSSVGTSLPYSMGSCWRYLFCREANTYYPNICSTAGSRLAHSAGLNCSANSTVSNVPRVLVLVM